MNATAVTFVTPHQGRTSGGVYVIEQLARRLAGTCEVCLVVLAGETRTVPGVRVVRARRSLRRALPGADVLIVPGDTDRLDELVALGGRVGRPVLLMQSLGVPSPQLTHANLAAVSDVIAVSSWLAERATALGACAHVVRPGLDRRAFFPPRARAARERRVALLAHHSPAKGVVDGLSALAEVRERVRGVEVHLFGTGAFTVKDGVHHGELSRAAVGSLLRSVAVFVCPSWEEGLGLPGLEAISCGAALATTDTGGSRDYALHGQTALVSPPHDPSALADGIIELLTDRPARRRISAAAERLVRDRYPSWAVASYRLEHALSSL